MKKSIKKYSGLILRITVSFALIYWVFSLVDLDQTFVLLVNADLRLIILSIIVFCSFLFVSAKRWQVLLSAFGYENTKYIKLVKYYWIGLFFNNFLPTSVGGDVVRAYYLSHDNQNKGESFASVVLERMLGFINTSLVSLVALLFIYEQFLLREIIWLAFFLLVFIIFLLLLIFNDPVFSLMTFWLEKIRFFDFGKKFQQIFSAFREFRKHHDKLFIAFFISAFGQLIIIVFNYLIYMALSGDTNFLPFLVVVPLTMIISLFPSINGLGTRESAYVVLLSLFGIAKEISLALAVLNFFIPLLISLFGGFQYIINKVPLRVVQWENNEDM